MINGVAGESESWLLGLVNRVVRCSHRNHGRPVTPRGGGQSYAVCLDCGARFPYDLKAMRVEPSVSGHSVDRPAPELSTEREKEEILDIPELGFLPRTPTRRETLWNESRWRRRDVGTVIVLCLGAVTLAGAFFYSGNRPTGARHVTATKHVRPPLPADSVEPSPAEPARPALPARSVESSPSLPAQESGTELAAAPESAAMASPMVPTEPEPVTEQKTIKSDSTPPPVPPPPNRQLRLEGKGSVIVLARKAGAALELAQHPGRLRKLIRRGALFTVPSGTPIKLVQGNSSGNPSVIKVRLMAGSMTGKEGWTLKSQISP
jgi:hypothetical protein